MSQERRYLFPPIEPYAVHRLKVSSLHEVHVAECGNRAGKPVILVHGGPGAGTNPTMPRFHDPAVHRIVLFDQRGSGKSTPHAEIAENTTWDLVADMERIRVHLGIERWQLFGGSWGSCLALAYAETHPERVRELILRGIFTLRRKELLWFYQEGASCILPDAFEAFLQPIPEGERGDLIAAYHRRLTVSPSRPCARRRFRRARLCDRLRADRVPLLPEPRLLRPRRPAHRQRPSAS
jgi:proline iminopeptidase